MLPGVRYQTVFIVFTLDPFIIFIAPQKFDVYRVPKMYICMRAYIVITHIGRAWVIQGYF